MDWPQGRGRVHGSLLVLTRQQPHEMFTTGASATSIAASAPCGATALFHIGEALELVACAQLLVCARVGAVHLTFAFAFPWRQQAEASLHWCQLSIMVLHMTDVWCMCLTVTVAMLRP